MIDNTFLDLLKGSSDTIPIIVPVPDKIKNVINRINVINVQEKLQRPVIKNIEKVKYDIKDIFIKKDINIRPQIKNISIKKYRSLPSLKESIPCPEGYIRSLKTGKCIKSKKINKDKMKFIDQDNSILNILKAIKV